MLGKLGRRDFKVGESYSQVCGGQGKKKECRDEKTRGDELGCMLGWGGLAAANPWGSEERYGANKNKLKSAKIV